MNNNQIVTSYYTNLNWFPLSLFKQFKKPVIIYFTLITVLHFMPFSPKKPASQLFTFIFVLLFSMVREFIEDRKRQILDRFQNKSKTQVYRYGWLSYEEKNWEQLAVGDIVAVHSGSEVPADLLLIHSPTNNAFIDSSNIDGESGLTQKLVF